MLVAARERSDPVVAVAHSHRELLRFPVEHACQRGPVEEAQPTGTRAAPVAWQQQVLEDAQVRKDAFALAVTRDVRNSTLRRILQVVDLGEAPARVGHQRRGPRGTIDAGEDADELALALAVEAGHADDLAPVQAEGNVRPLRPDAQAVGLQQHLVVQHLFDLFRKCTVRRRRLARHQAQQVLLGDVLPFEHTHIAAVSQHRRAVRDFDQFGDAVRDDDDGRALFAKLAQLGKEPLRRIEVERGRGFVEDQHIGLAQQRPADRDPLLDAEREAADQRARVYRLCGQLAHQRCRCGQLRRLRQRTREQRVRTHEQVLDDGTLVGHQHLLEYRGDASRASLMRRHGCVAQDRDLSRVGRQHAGQHLGQRALAAAVATDDGVNLTA